MRILIAGCGYVGRALAGMLAADGETVFAMSRSGTVDLPGVTGVRADLASPDSLRALPDKLDAIVFAASPDEGSDEAYRKVYVDGLRNLIAATRKTSPGLRRLLVTTSTGVYGQDGGERVDENSETNPTRFSGRRLLESEAVAASASCPSVAVRFGGIYGPGRTRFLEGVRSGEITTSDSASYTNRIHRDDCAGVLRHLLRVDDPAPVYIGVDDDPADRNEVIRWMADRFGIEAGEPPGGDDGAARGKRCSNERLRASGYRFRYPTYREGYAAVLDEIDANATGPRGG